MLLGLSGGVDSSVCAALLSQAIPGQLTCIYIDHGFLATSEGDDILRIIENAAGGSSKVDVKIPNGHNVAYMLSVSYSLGSFMKE